MSEIRFSTVGQLIAALQEKVSDLPEGLDTQVAVGSCDGVDLALLFRVDADVFTFLKQDLTEQAAVMVLRGHRHTEDDAYMLHGIVGDAGAN